MKYYFLLTWIFLLVHFSNCFSQTSNESKKLDNSIFGKTYSDFHEIDCFKNYKNGGESLLSAVNGQDYGIMDITNNGYHVVLFVKSYSSASKPTFQILDTLSIGKLKGNEFIGYQLCRKKGANDCEIIAIVISENKQYYNKVIRAWRADRLKGKIYEIDKSDIDCLNEGYGV